MMRRKLKPDTHENYSRKETVKGSTDRGFGIVFAVVFVAVGLWPLTGGGPVRVWSLAVAAAILAIALMLPRLLAPFNRAWMWFGLLLHRVTNPLIMGLIFYLAVTPTALIFKMLGKDPLHRRLDRSAKTYWIDRTPPGPEPETMKHQF